MVSCFVVACCRRQEIARNKLGALVKELIKRMLPVRARFPPNDGTGGIRRQPPCPVHGLPVALHIALLKISRKTMHILIVWKNGFGMGVKEIDVPKTYQSQDYRNIFFKFFVAKMFIHRVRPRQQGFKVFKTDGTSNRQTNSRPQGIAPPYP